MRDFFKDDVVFDPDAVGILLAAFDGALQSIKNSGARLSDKQAELCGRHLQSTLLNRPSAANLTNAVYARALCFTWLRQI